MSELPPLKIKKTDRVAAVLLFYPSQVEMNNEALVGETAARFCRERQLLAALNEVHDLKEELDDWKGRAQRQYEENVDRIHQQSLAEAEVFKLSTRIDEIQLAETKAVEELARVREENLWRDVRQELPPNSRDVLILLGNALVERGYYYHVGAPIDGWYHRGERPDNVTHWMPLPRYPKAPGTNEGGE